MDAERLRSVRQAVFVLEQHVRGEEEWDEADPECMHVLATANDGSPIGTGRLDRHGKIGRMAVLPEWRGHDVGKRMIEMLLEIAREQGFERVYLNAQISAQGFYEKFGFTTVGDTFLEAEIVHVRMEREFTHK